MLCSDSGARVQSLTPRSRFSDLCGFGGIWPSPPSQTLIDTLPILFIKCTVLSASHASVPAPWYSCSISACSCDPFRMTPAERFSHVGLLVHAGFGCITVWLSWGSQLSSYSIVNLVVKGLCLRLLSWSWSAESTCLRDITGLTVW